MELALACDLTVAAADCYFGEPEVRFGSGIVALLLPWLTSPKQAKELLLTGEDRVTAARAHELGLVNRVVPRESLLEDTLALARQIAGNDPIAVKLTKQAINRSLDAAGFRTALRQALDLDVQIETAESAESREFNVILKRDGAKAAIAWRNSRANAEATEGGP
jgi:enoyl-CoA hydratase